MPTPLQSLGCDTSGGAMTVKWSPVIFGPLDFTVGLQHVWRVSAACS